MKAVALCAMVGLALCLVGALPEQALPACPVTQNYCAARVQPFLTQYSIESCKRLITSPLYYGVVGTPPTGFTTTDIANILYYVSWDWYRNGPTNEYGEVCYKIGALESAGIDTSGNNVKVIFLDHSAFADRYYQLSGQQLEGAVAFTSRAAYGSGTYKGFLRTFYVWVDRQPGGVGVFTWKKCDLNYCDASPYWIDLQGTLMHEFGHGIGFEHPHELDEFDTASDAVAAGAACGSPTMWPIPTGTDRAAERTPTGSDYEAMTAAYCDAYVAVGNTFAAHPGSGVDTLLWDESDPSASYTYELGLEDDCFGPEIPMLAIAAHNAAYTQDNVHYRAVVAAPYSRLNTYVLTVPGTGQRVVAQAAHANGQAPIIPAAPQLRTPEIVWQGGASKARVHWGGGGAGPFYLLRSRYDLQACDHASQEWIGPLSDTAYVDAVLAAGTTAHYRVKAAGTGAMSALSNEKVATLAVAVVPPTVLVRACPGGDAESIGLSGRIVGVTQFGVLDDPARLRLVLRAPSGSNARMWSSAGAEVSSDTCGAISFDPTNCAFSFQVRRLSGAGELSGTVLLGDNVLLDGIGWSLRSLDQDHRGWGSVDQGDALLVEAHLGEQGQGSLDLDGNGVVSQGDLDVWIAPHRGHSIQREVVSPNGGQVLGYGSYPTIQWHRGWGDSALVSISLSRDGLPGWSEPLATSVSDDGSAVVPLYTAQAGNADFRVLVEHWVGTPRATRENLVGWDQSDATLTIEGAGGGGCPIVDSWAPGGWIEENSILGRSLTGASMLDGYRLKWPWPSDSTVSLRVREEEAEVTALDQVRLVSVDHRPEVSAFASGERVVLGTRIPARSVRTSNGTDISDMFAGDGYWASSGETLYVELESGGDQSGLRANPSDGDDPFLFDDGGGKGGVPQFAGMPAPATAREADAEVLNGTGIIMQVPDGLGGWREAAHHYPREYRSETLFDSIRVASIRLLFLDGHRVKFLGAVAEVADTVIGTKLSLRQARHSRLGDVRDAVVSAGNVTTALERGDTLSLVFDNPSLKPGVAREYFLLSRGVYSANLPARQTPGEVPRVFALGQNRPNPANGPTMIQFDAPREARVRIDVFDLQGRKVKTLTDGVFAGGAHSVTWNKSGEDGQSVRPGIYLYRMLAPGFVAQRKLVIIH